MNRLRQLSFIIILIVPICVFGSEVFNTPVFNTEANSSSQQIDEERAKTFGLSASEWKSYQHALTIYGKSYFGKYTPPEILGILSDNEQDRRHFAEIAARQEHDKIANELTFQRAFTDAGKRLYANEPVLKSENLFAFTPKSKPIFSSIPKSKLSSGDHVVWFVDVNASDVSQSALELIQKIQSVSGSVLDIYCVNAKTDSDIQTFAKRVKLPLDLVSSNQITLNRDHGQFSRTVHDGKLPTLIWVHDGASSVRQIGDL